MNEHTSAQDQNTDDAEVLAGEDIQNKTDPNSRRPDPAYEYPEDEYEIQMKRIASYFVSGWDALEFDKRVELSIGILGILGLFVTAVFTVFMYFANEKAATAAESAAKTAQRTLELDRPYVSIEVEPISDLKFNQEGHGFLRLGTTVVNYGRNPALNAKVWAQFLSQAKGSPKSETDPIAFCENLKKSGLAGMNGGTYFPQVPYKAGWIGEDYGSGTGIVPRVFMAKFIACVAYQSPFSDDWLYTGKTYLILKATRDPMGGGDRNSRGRDCPSKERCTGSLHANNIQIVRAQALLRLPTGNAPPIG